jgi:ferric-dicitrate binding protein FerR (iron transport regulator)
MNQPDSRVAELIEKHLAGGLDPAGTAELRQALADRPELARHVYEAARMHRCLQTSLGTAAQSGHARGGTRVPRRFRRFPALALAAAAAFVLGVFAWQALVWEPRAPSEPLVETKAPAAVGQARSEGLLVTRDTRETALPAGAPLFAGDRLRAGTRADLVLADGSSVRLDSGTALGIAAPGAGERAHLELTAGRVFLRVAPAPGRFRLEAGAAAVEVLGTVFGVGLENGAAVASVYEGRVRVATDAGELELGRGESARADADSAPPLRTAGAPDELLAWARDWTRFDDRPLGEVLDWIAANSPYRFTASPAVRARRVSVAIADEALSRTLETLLITCNLTTITRDHDVVIQGKNP